MLTSEEKKESIYTHVVATKEKQDNYGNTYHNVLVVDLSTGDTQESGKTYGYGRAYEQTAAKLIGVKYLSENMSKILFLPAIYVKTMSELKNW